MQGNWIVCVPLKYLILIPDIQEAKCFEFTVKILPPALIVHRGGQILPPSPNRLFSRLSHPTSQTKK